MTPQKFNKCLQRFIRRPEGETELFTIEIADRYSGSPLSTPEKSTAE